jgi:hypothetical protein
MNNILALMQREWLQHRFAWALLATVPTLLAVLLTSFGEINLHPSERGEHVAVALAMASLAGGMGLHLLMLWVVALIITAGIARRDHGDRSVEFWMSLPTGHAASLAVPLGVHLVVAPLVALGVGLVSGLLASFVLVSRTEGAAAWAALPWGTVMAAALAMAARLAAGLLLATLWLAPLLMGMVVLTAWLGRWGLAILALGLGLGSTVLDQAFGIHAPAAWLVQVFSAAGRSLANTGGGTMVFETSNDLAAMLERIPAWAWHDTGEAVGLVASPVMVFGLALAAACFAMLVQWRRRGAPTGG